MRTFATRNFLKSFVPLFACLVMSACFSGIVHWDRPNDPDPDVAGASDSIDDSEGGPGRLDATFAGNGFVTLGVEGLDAFGTSLALQADGKIVVAGYRASSVDSLDDFVVARFHSDGTLDDTFGLGGVRVLDVAALLESGPSRSDQAVSVLVDTSNHIIVSGTANAGVSQGDNFVYLRLTASGAVDLSFGDSGSGGDIVDFALGGVGSDFDRMHASVLASDGSTFFVGETRKSTSYSSSVAHATAGGELDTTYSADGMNTYTFGATGIQQGTRAILLQPNGLMLLAGFIAKNQGFQDFQVHVVRVENGGPATPDNLFGNGGSVAFVFDTQSSVDGANAIAIQTDDKPVVGGFATLSTKKRFGLARLNSNGSLDTSFGLSGTRVLAFSGGHDEASAVAVDTSGRIVIAGGCDDNRSVCLARYDTTGTLDPTFGQGGKRLKSLGADLDWVTAMKIDANGNIVLTGTLKENGVHKILLARFSP